MSKSLETRLTEIGGSAKDEFIRDCGSYGWIGALEIWKGKLDGYSSIVGVQKLCEAETGKKDYGRVPLMPVADNRSIVDLILERFESRVVELRDLLAEKDEQLAQQKRLNEYLQSQLSMQSAELKARLIREAEKIAVL